MSSVLDDDVFVSDNAVERGIRTYEGILHKDRILNHRVFSDAYSAEKYRIFHFSFDYTAVGDERV